MKCSIGLFFSVLVLVCTQAAKSQDSTRILTLKQCIETALANNADVRKTDFQMQAAQVALQLAKGNILPFANATIAHGINTGRNIDPFTNGYVNQQVNFGNYGLNTSLYIWNGSSIRNNVRQNELSYEASKMDLQQGKDNLTINVILAYLQVLNNNEQLNRAKQQVEVTRQQAGRLSILNDNGAIAPATFYDMKGQLADDELNVVTVRNALETAKITLAQLMNQPYDATMQLEKINIDVDALPYEGTSTDVYQQALHQFASIKAADLRRRSTEQAVKVARGQLLPTLSLNGGIGTNYSSAASLSTLLSTTDIQTNNYVMVNNSKLPVYSPQPVYANDKISYGSQWKNNFNSYFNITLQIPILNGLTSRTRLNQAKINQRQSSFDEETTKTALQQAIEQAYVNRNTAYERLQQLTQQVKDFGESFRSAQVKFDAGAITSVDYLIAKNNMDRANINLIAAKYDCVLRSKILDYYQSKPLW